MSNDDLQKLIAQEKELQFNTFNNKVAWDIGCAIKHAAEQQSVTVAIEIFCFGQVLFSYAMPETSIDRQDWAKRKRQTVLRYGQSSYYLGQYNASKQREFEEQAHIDATEYCAHGGSFPVRIKHCGVVGAITVAGLPQLDDHNLVVSVLRKYLIEH